MPKEFSQKGGSDSESSESALFCERGAADDKEKPPFW